MKFERQSGAPSGVLIYIIVADVSSLPIVQTRKGVPYKVGTSRNPKFRLKQIQTGCPFRLKIFYGDLSTGYDDGRDEKEIHRRLVDSAVGGEWFWGDPEDAYRVICEINNENGDREYENWRRSL